MMHPRLYRLIETHQRIDDALRREQRRRAPDLIELLRLKQLRLRTKTLINRLSRTAVPI
jgi:hypothetical protein